MKIKYIINPADITEFNRVQRWLERNRPPYRISFGHIFIFEESPKVKKILKKWQIKYDTDIFTIKEHNMK